MERNKFESKMLKAKVLQGLTDLPDYWTGYMRGLRRVYYGEKFGTEEEHLRFSDAIHSELGRGYTDGLKEGK